MLRLAYNIFRPSGNVRGAVAVVHGMAEHRKRYIRFAEYLADRGYGVITYDLPGHGESVAETPGYFGDEDGWLEMISSASRAVKRAKKEFPGVPVFLFGHSMGTMISRCYIQDHDKEIKGLILSGAPNWQAATTAGIALAKQLRGLRGKKGKSKLLDRLVTGNFNKSVKDPKTPYDWLSYNEENVQEYIDDPYSGFGFTIQGYLDELEGMRQMARTELYKCLNKELPIFFVAGEDDPCTGGLKGLSDSMDTLRKAGYGHVTKKLYPHMRHEILREKEHEKVFRDIADWLDSRTD